MNELQLLREVVDRYDETGQPLPPSAVVDPIDADVARVESCLERFESNHLVARVDDGFRPTITARELLELDIDLDEDSLLILDTVPEEC